MGGFGNEGNEAVKQWAAQSFPFDVSPCFKIKKLVIQLFLHSFRFARQKPSKLKILTDAMKLDGLRIS